MAKKLEYIKSVLLKTEGEVLGAPVADTEKDKDTSEHRHFILPDKVLWNHLYSIRETMR